MALLKTVHMGWRERSLEDSARQIAELGRELHERLAIAVDNITRLGSRIESAVKQYNALVGSVESRLMPSARKFEDLHADSAKQIPPAIQTVDTAVRHSALVTGADHEDASS
jgi:DNA recombination protein RmuC